MGKRNFIEKFIARFCAPPRWKETCENDSIDIFVIRNNDIGDLILTTPLFQALKEFYPNARICVGIGDWNRGVLDQNPYVDQAVPLNAPWHNKFSCKHSPNSPVGILKSLLYIYCSPELCSVRVNNYGMGIDVLGSQEGSLLMHRCAIPIRLGTKGYGGGYTGCQRYREFKLDQPVSESILEYPKLLGMTSEQLPPSKPQIYLRQKEIRDGMRPWSQFPPKKRIVVSTGAGFKEKCWPVHLYEEVVQQLAKDKNNGIVFVGSESEATVGKQFQELTPSLVNLAGKTNLRETFAVLYHADLVVCNSTMFMHVAAAFDIPNIVLLGPWYNSAKLHAQQWGHPLTRVLGPEVSERRYHLASPQEVIQLANQMLQTATL